MCNVFLNGVGYGVEVVENDVDEWGYVGVVFLVFGVLYCFIVVVFEFLDMFCFGFFLNCCVKCCWFCYGDYECELL